MLCSSKFIQRTSANRAAGTSSGYVEYGELEGVDLEGYMTAATI